MSDVQEGYKMSEVGVIPEDWKVKKLGVIADVKTGPFGSSLHERDYVEDGTPIITVEHLGERGVVHENLPMVSDFDRKRLNAYALQPDDIVFSRVGSVDRNSLIKEKENGWLFSGRLLRIRLNTKYIFPAYLSYYFHQEPTKQRIRSVAVGQTMASLNTEILKNIEVAHPPLPEQQAIASALSDVDALITALEQLITKKRNIKQGAMQQLITGKKRLPGFDGEWEVKKLGEVGSFSKGKGIRKDEVVSEGLPCIRYGEIYTTHSNYIKSFKSFITQSLANESIEIKTGDLLFAGSGETAEEIGKCVAFVGNERVFAGGDIVILRPSSINNNSLFLGFLLNNPIVTRQKVRMGQGDAVVHISGKNLSEIQTPLPPTKDEQTAIAQILFDMDTEIESLEQKRNKYKAIKQGMMQELLTGKRRLLA